ncbi:MAG: FtsQ-type POTRA domain-containing protein [bacterium]|nr:FtsQ-type POTRA domain-containing protein [bacterium]
MKKYRKPYRIKKKKSLFKNRFFGMAILVLIIFGGIFYLVCFSSIFQIKDINISGNQKVQTQDVENLIKEKINQKLLFFPTKSIFLIKSNEIVESLLEKFLKIDKVNLKRRLPASLIVEIQERLPFGVWCEVEEDKSSSSPFAATREGENCFYIDKEGIIFEKNPPKEEFIIKSEELISQGFLGEKVIEKVLLESIFEIQRNLKESLKINIEEIIILEKEKINAKTSEGWEIYFDPTGDINWQLTKLSLVLEKEIPPERRKDLEYIDLRFGNFAPYKYK